MVRKIGVIALVALVILSLFAAFAWHFLLEDIPVPTSPVHIDGNRELLDQAGRYHWPGNGTTLNPIVIGGLNLTSYNSENVFTLKNTDLCFQLRNCSFYWGLGRTGTGGGGILLSNVQNGEVMNCSVSSFLIALEMIHCHSLSLHDNRLSDNLGNGLMRIDHCDNDSIERNLISENGRITINSSETIRFANNTVQALSSPDPLLSILNSSNCVLADNRFLGAERETLSLNGSNDNLLIHNNLSPVKPWESYAYAISLEGCHGDELRLNIIQCQRTATNFYGTLLRNSAAFDDTGLNSWNDTMYGNYWFDWVQPDLDLEGIVDQPYPIDGGHGAMDYLPLVQQP